MPQRNELYTDFLRYSKKFTVNLTAPEISEMTGNLFKVQSGSPWITNVDNTSLMNEALDILSIQSRIKGETLMNIGLEKGVDNPPSIITAYGTNAFFREFLDNLFFTIRINAKEYLRRVPAKQFPTPNMLGQGGDEKFWTVWPTDLQLYEYPASPENTRKNADRGGYNLRNIIQIKKRDVFEIIFQLGDLVNMPLYYHNATKGWLYPYAGGFSFYYEIILMVNKYRDMQ